MTSTMRVSMVWIALTTSGCGGSVSRPSVQATGKDGGTKMALADGSTAAAPRASDASAGQYADHCPAASRTSTTDGIAACPAAVFDFQKPQALLSAASFGGGVTFRALHQNTLVATRASWAGVESFVVLFTFPVNPGSAVDTTVLELPASERSRTIVATGPLPSSPTDPHQFEALACNESECSFFVPAGASLEHDRTLPSVPKDNYRLVECRRSGDTCDLCAESPTARLCFANGVFEAEKILPPDVAVCCPVATEDLRFTVDADFRGLSRLALTRSGDLLNDRAVFMNDGRCCVQGSGFSDAVGFDVITCGEANNPMILTGSTLYGTTWCVMSR